MCPEGRWIKDKRHVIQLIDSSIATPQVSMDKRWFDGVSTGLKRPEKPRNDLIERVLFEIVKFFPWSCSLNIQIEHMP